MKIYKVTIGTMTRRGVNQAHAIKFVKSEESISLQAVLEDYRKRYAGFNVEGEEVQDFDVFEKPIREETPTPAIAPKVGGVKTEYFIDGNVKVPLSEEIKARLMVALKARADADYELEKIKGIVSEDVEKYWWVKCVYASHIYFDRDGTTYVKNPQFKYPLLTKYISSPLTEKEIK